MDFSILLIRLVLPDLEVFNLISDLMSEADECQIPFYLTKTEQLSIVWIFSFSSRIREAGLFKKPDT